MDLPATLPIKVLTSTHPDYNPLVLTPSGKEVPILMRNGDLYESDDRFARNKSLYLRSRQADRNPDYVRVRQACARSPELGTTQINRLAGACFVEEPRLEVPEGAAEYWRLLNTDADGTGRDLASILYATALQFNVYRRAYLAVDFPVSARPARSLGDALRAMNGERADADAMITSIPCEVVDDWECDARGNLSWVRLHYVECVRVGVEQAAKERHLWCFFTSEGRTDFTAEKKIGNNWAEKMEVPSAPLEPYAYGGRLPIVRIELPAGMCSMTLMAPLLLEYFNNKAALQFIYDMNCYQNLAIFSNNKYKSIFSSEMSCFALDPGDRANFLAPSGVPFEQLRMQCDKIKEDIYQAVGNAVELAAAKEGFGRQTGAAVENKGVAFNLNIDTHRAFLKDALERCVDLIKSVRKEEIEIKVLGFDAEGSEKIEDAPPLEINGAVADGLIALMRSGVVTLPEVRRRLGFSDMADLKEVKVTEKAKEAFVGEEPVARAPGGSVREPARVRMAGVKGQEGKDE